MKTHEEDEVGALSPSILEGVEGQLHASAALPLEERALGTHCIEGMVGPRVGEHEKISCPFRKSNSDSYVVKSVTESLYRLSYHCSKSHCPVRI
jgi:hypothetical protein